MDKDIKDMLKDLLNKMGEKLEKVEKVDSMISEAINEPCKICIDKKENGEACLGVEGSRLALLVTLAGMEKSILNKLDCDNQEFSFIKSVVGTKEGDNE